MLEAADGEDAIKMFLDNSVKAGYQDYLYKGLSIGLY